MNVAILVPRREGFADRDRIWRFCEARWQLDLPEYQLVEGTHDDGPFNRGAALNAAARAAGDWDVAVCIDADVIVNADQVRAAVNLAASTGGPTLAYNERLHLSPKGTTKILRGYRGNWLSPGFVFQTHNDSCSSAYVVTRDLWDQVGGFDEAFVGWGWEDIAFRCATETMSGIELVKIGGKLWHLYHVVSSGNNQKEPTFKANKERGTAYRNARMHPAHMSRLLTPFAAREQRAAEMGARIPKIVHRTVPSETAREVEVWWRQTKRLHTGWDLRTHRDPLDPNAWPRTSALWDKCQNGAQRAGLIRLEALCTYGGIYLDSDVQLFRSLEPLRACSAFAGWEDAKVVPDAVLGCVPHHPAFEQCLALACERVADGQDAWQSGPGVTTKLLPGRGDVLLLPPGSFYPVHYTEKEHTRGHNAASTPWTFGIHHWHGSWLP